MVIIGVSDEDEGKIEEVFVDKLGAKYPIVKIDASDVAGYGIKFYPSYYSIAPDGTVHSVPDDRMPGEEQIEELLKSVTLVPPLPDGAAYNTLRKLWEKQDFAKLRDHIDKTLGIEGLEAEVKEVFTAQKAALDKRVESVAARVAKLGQGPDYNTASQALRKIERDWKGFDVAAAAKKELDRFQSDPKIKKEAEASRALEKLLAKHDRSSQSQVKKLMKAIPAFIKRYEGTHAAQEAQKLLGGN